MKKMMKLLAVVGVAGLVMALATSGASATCIPNKSADTFSDGIIYVIAPTDATDASVVGRWWQQGARAAANEGAAGNSADEWFYFFEGSTDFGTINNQMGSYTNTGCPSTRLISTLETPTAAGGAAFVAMTVDECPGCIANYPYGSYPGSVTMVEMPRLQVTSSSRSAGGVLLNFTIPAVSAGVHGPGASTAITGYQLVRFDGNADPGRAGEQWTALGAVIPAAGGGAATGSIDVPCSGTATDQFVGVRLSYDNGALLSDLVGRSVRVECDPTMADPNRDFKLIEGPKDKPRPARER